MYSAAVTDCTICVNLTFCPWSVFMSFVWFSEQTAVILLNIINNLIFVTEMRCVFLEVGTKFLNSHLYVQIRWLFHGALWLHESVN